MSSLKSEVNYLLRTLKTKDQIEVEQFVEITCYNIKDRNDVRDLFVDSGYAVDTKSEHGEYKVFIKY